MNELHAFLLGDKCARLQQWGTHKPLPVVVIETVQSCESYLFFSKFCLDYWCTYAWKHQRKKFNCCLDHPRIYYHL